jgi:NTP pyrophosphatase (non-canonical NTP hydrolase)
MTTLAEAIEECYELAVEKGWSDPPPTFGEAVALLCSEACEALECYRTHDLDDMTDGDIYLGQGGLPKPRGVGSEFADVFIRLCHYCKLFGIDLQAEYDRKMAYNRLRDYRHGGKLL